MSWRKVVPGLTGIVALSLAATVSADEVGDWRLEFLTEEGVPTGTAALLKLRDGFEMTTERLEKAVGKLAADDFATREQAQREILLMGSKVLPWLRRLPRSDDPEVRMRLAGIERTLQLNGRWTKEDLIRQAVTSLLRERLREKPREPAATLFVELFQHPAASLTGGYRQFRYNAGKGLTGLVSDGLLRMKGNRVDEGDQRLLLDARKLTDKAEFPDSFRIEVKLGGETGGQGAYHVGVSIGNVRALYHPGYQTGGFRFERVDTHEHLTENTSMGFDPAPGKLQRMNIDVKRLKGGKVELAVVVSNGDKTFNDRKIFEENEIGKLNHLGLERSGRAGGDGLFDDLVVDLGAH